MHLSGGLVMIACFHRKQSFSEGMSGTGPRRYWAELGPASYAKTAPRNAEDNTPPIWADLPWNGTIVDAIRYQKSALSESRADRGMPPTPTLWVTHDCFPAVVEEPVRRAVLPPENAAYLYDTILASVTQCNIADLK